MQTMTLASIYETQGHKREALEIYWKIYEDDPSNMAAFKAIERLCKERRDFYNDNPKITNFFINMKTSQDFSRFEKWLLKC
ncbi:MAG: hypothetical protein DSZ06_01350 [Sulfurospirillum sp.]|nr:MAG: hypothetical protein DSZ06_01350 [Sulfurospirillum sp.]